MGSDSKIYLSNAVGGEFGICRCTYRVGILGNRVAARIRANRWTQAAPIPLGGNCMAKHSHNEVQESLRELTRIFRPKDPRKFVKEYIRKYRITGGYEDELTVFVERELVKLNSPAS